jgi:hypothetical protein|uniref:Uncharacterized protein n=1 Tax=viral metagenome TaxID=1070528 RepID=A0A6C0AMN1_9ZZZZ
MFKKTFADTLKENLTQDSFKPLPSHIQVFKSIHKESSISSNITDCLKNK